MVLDASQKKRTLVSWYYQHLNIRTQDHRLISERSYVRYYSAFAVDKNTALRFPKIQCRHCKGAVTPKQVMAILQIVSMPSP